MMTFLGFSTLRTGFLYALELFYFTSLFCSTTAAKFIFGTTGTVTGFFKGRFTMREGSFGFTLGMISNSKLSSCSTISVYRTLYDSNSSYSSLLSSIPGFNENFCMFARRFFIRSPILLAAEVKYLLFGILFWVKSYLGYGDFLAMTFFSLGASSSSHIIFTVYCVSCKKLMLSSALGTSSSSY